jgi:single-strand DNA-binding protein
MAFSINRVQLIGNLGFDPDFRVGASGTHVLNLSVATTENYKDRSGDWKSVTDWHKVVMFGKNLDKLAARLSKGSRVFVDGKLKTESYEKDGEKRYVTKINAFIIEPVVMEPRTERRDNQQQSRDKATANDFPPSPDEDYADPIGSGDDIPF